MNRCQALLLALFPFLPLAAAGLQEEDADYFRKWLEQDVLYIITPEEKSVFKNLQTPEEKEQFIQQFWRRRDPDPRTAVNEFKDEHYRRVAYANEQFGSGFPGWQTDRGMIYIILGPADSVEKNPTGGPYHRPIEEGGGTTQTFPFEVWRYRFVDSIGGPVDIEFVDPSHSGEYYIALRPDEKDALLTIPGAGLTFGEQAGYEDRRGRILSGLLMRRSGTDVLEAPRLRGLSGLSSFEKVQRYFEITRPPAIRYPDLKAAVDAQVYYDQLPFAHRSDAFALSETHFLVPLTVALEMQQLHFEAGPSGGRRAVLQVYGRVETMSREIVYEFEDVFRAEVPAGRPLQGTTRYQKALPLSTGRYKLQLVVKDETSGRMGTQQSLILLPRRPALQVGLSSLVLSDLIVPAPEAELTNPFVTSGGLRVYPSLDLNFREGAPLGFYLEAYGVPVDSSTLVPLVKVRYQIRGQRGEVVKEEDITRISARHIGDRLCIARFWKSSDLPAGTYRLEVIVEDQLAGIPIRAESSFTVQ